MDEVEIRMFLWGLGIGVVLALGGLLVLWW